MGIAWAFIKSRVGKFFAGFAVVLAAVVGLIGIGRKQEGDKRDAKRHEDRLKAIKKKKEITKDVENSDDSDLIDGITRD